MASLALAVAEPTWSAERRERLASFTRVLAYAALAAGWVALAAPYLVPGFVIDTKLEPGARLVTFGNGRVVREWIVDVDDTRRRVAWSVKDEPFQHHNASAQVFEIDRHRCRFVWIADVLPDELCGFVTGLIEQGLSVIRSTLEKNAS